MPLSFIFKQYFCTTGNGYPELTLNVLPYNSASLQQMTNGKVIVKTDSSRTFMGGPKCDVDFANDANNPVLLNNNIPSGKTWRVTGNAGISINSDVTVKGKLIL